MATLWYRTDHLVAKVAAAHNDLKSQLGAGPNFHLDAYESPVGAANPTELGGALTLVNEVRAVHEAHKADLLAHKFKGPALQTARAVNQVSAFATANVLKADLNLHFSVASIHYNVDAVNTIAAADATDLASLLLLCAALKKSLNAHLASAPSAHSIRVVEP